MSEKIKLPSEEDMREMIEYTDFASSARCIKETANKAAEISQKLERGGLSEEERARLVAELENTVEKGCRLANNQARIVEKYKV